MSLLIQMKVRFGNIDWPEMPSTFQIIKKVEKRTQAFDKILKKAVEIIRTNATAKKPLSGLVYAFLFNEGSNNIHSFFCGNDKTH